MLIIFGGLPGTGKTSIAKHLARRLQAVYLRIDSIEQTIRNTDRTIKEIGPVGYHVAYVLAADNLSLGLTVIADSVNSIAITRQAWRDVALKNQQAFFEIELICSDQLVHQTRVIKRVLDIPNHELPNWQAIVNREYEPWLDSHLVIDTSMIEIEDAVENILQYLQI